MVLNHGVARKWMNVRETGRIKDSNVIFLERAKKRRHRILFSS